MTWFLSFHLFKTRLRSNFTIKQFQIQILINIKKSMMVFWVSIGLKYIVFSWVNLINSKFIFKKVEFIRLLILIIFLNLKWLNWFIILIYLLIILCIICRMVRFWIFFLIVIYQIVYYKWFLNIIYFIHVFESYIYYLILNI